MIISISFCNNFVEAYRTDHEPKLGFNKFPVIWEHFFCLWFEINGWPAIRTLSYYYYFFDELNFILLDLYKLVTTIFVVLQYDVVVRHGDQWIISSGTSCSWIISSGTSVRYTGTTIRLFLIAGLLLKTILIVWRLVGFCVWGFPQPKTYNGRDHLILYFIFLSTKKKKKKKSLGNPPIWANFLD